MLCVCVGNISRSPMMQAVLQPLLGDGFRVESAGISRDLAGRPANARSVACLQERGVDLRGHVSRWIGDLDLGPYRWFVCVGPAEAQAVRTLVGVRPATLLIANESNGGIPDPYELGLPGYRDCLALLDRVLPLVAEEISSGAEG